MYLAQWDVFLGPIKQTVLTEVYTYNNVTLQSLKNVLFREKNISSVEMASVIEAIVHKHTFSCNKQVMLIR